MLFVKKLPWTSLALLVIAYGTFGWFLSTAKTPWLAWLVALAWLLVLTWALIAPLKNSSAFISRWFKSDTIAFLVLLMLASSVAIVLFWLHIFVQVLIIVAAETLARVDIQTANYNEPQAFWILTLTSLVGLGIGWSLHFGILALPHHGLSLL